MLCMEITEFVVVEDHLHPSVISTHRSPDCGGFLIVYNVLN